MRKPSDNMPTKTAQLNYTSLNLEKALIWRVLHRDNLPWVLQNGLHCGNSDVRSPQWVSIGNAELIDKRAARHISMAPGGTLGDYVPFYFTPFSVMLRNIHKHVPMSGSLGIVCHTDVVRVDIESKMQSLGAALPVHTRPNWYFS